jgi:hypothetical protein
MRFIGIDIGSEKHFVAIVDEAGKPLRKPTPFAEDDAGYEELRSLLGEPSDAFVAMEATGHYWQNLFAFLHTAGFEVALLNPTRTARFAGEDLRRAKTDALDALGIARFAQQKRPGPTPLTDEATLELRELVRLRDRLVQDLGDRARQVHRTLDLSFPEFTRHVRDVASAKATTLLMACPTGAAFREADPNVLAELKYDGRHVVGLELAQRLCEAAKIRSVVTTARRASCRCAMRVRTSREGMSRGLLKLEWRIAPPRRGSGCVERRNRHGKDCQEDEGSGRGHGRGDRGDDGLNRARTVGVAARGAGAR